jgi:hypothetical protein
MKQNQELAVFITTGESSCSECGEELGRRAWITLGDGLEEAQEERMYDHSPEQQ